MSSRVNGDTFPISRSITPTRLHELLKAKSDASPGVVLEENEIMSFPSA
jgi:hypothetical protein